MYVSFQAVYVGMEKKRRKEVLLNIDYARILSTNYWNKKNGTRRKSSTSSQKFLHCEIRK